MDLPDRLRTADDSGLAATGTARPLLSWRPVAPGAVYEVEAAADEDFTEVVGAATAATAVDVPLPGPALASCEARWWRVRVRGGEWSAPARVEAALLEPGDWTARPVAAGGERGSVPLLRREFALPQGIRSARLYVTALGVHRTWINGRPVGPDLLEPGWTEYGSRLLYATYDVTGLLVEGPNAIGAAVGDGWYRGPVGWLSAEAFYGDRTGLLAQLEVETASGRTVVGTDASWRASHGAVRSAGILAGCTTDLRAEPHGWRIPGFDDAAWEPVEVLDLPAGLEQRSAPGVQVVETRPVAAVPVGGRWTVDTGQNLSGYLRINATGPAGTRITVRHAEVLDAEGRLHTRPLRGAAATEVYILDGSSAVLEPAFTFHGFRFAEITVDAAVEGGAVEGGAVEEGGIECGASEDGTGTDGGMVEEGAVGNGAVDEGRVEEGTAEKSTAENGTVEKSTVERSTVEKSTVEKSTVERSTVEIWGVEAVAISSALRRTGRFECSDKRVNRLYHNVVWSQVDNFVAIPTDCPQRDERLGWTGDIQVFAPTACRNADARSFLRGWLKDLAIAQHPDGKVAHVVPDILADQGDWGSGSTGWGDAAVAVPWALYEAYGDTATLRDQYASMRAWVDWGERRLDGDLIWSGGFHFGDWLDPGAPPENPAQATTPTPYTATASLVRSARTLAAAARLLGHDADADRYAALGDSVAAALWERYGEQALETQTGCAMAIAYGIAPEAERARAGDRLAALVRAAEGRIATGFLGTPLVLPALTATGHHAEAYLLLLNERCPGWLHQVACDATTVWERWDAIREDGSIHPGDMEGGDSMLSFNHYAYGAVAEWLYTTAAGLAPGAPGWTRVRFAPVPGGGLTWAAAEIDAPTGRAAIRWELGEDFTAELTVPPGAEAEFHPPPGDWASAAVDGVGVPLGIVPLGPGAHRIVLSPR
ncbi:alpha-L-rhamnosidase [Glycomyces albidus]|uniref:alpha-L-rhamnosidase n=1 Tax=Glycomyces albidus TaxID=2656774 RepID=A0A6L5GBS9_9ACTN|nr:alpha-L-rhamnosidase [Glycomyces albidus]MQM27078.1 Bacterial alpha-L-rhamnosidase [Glycomyces albidus]